MQRRNVFLAAALCLSLVSFAPAQDGAPAPPANRPQYKPKNLQVLPENTDLHKVMREYSDALGVDCEYCHAPRDPVTHKEDRASDANPMKNVARYMIRMNDDINDKYLTQLPKGVPDVDTDAKVNCGTCHRGHAKPEAFVAPPRQEHMDHDRPAMAPPSGAPATPPSRM